MFESTGPGTEMKVIREFPHPEGRLKAGEIDADRAGRGHQAPASVGPGQSGRSTRDVAAYGQPMVTREQDATDRVAGMFARDLNDFLKDATNRGKFDRLVVVAPPSFLGMIREHMGSAVERKVTHSINKDLGDADARTLREHIQDEVLV